MPPRHPLSSVQVPAPAGSAPGGAPVVASAARRGTNVAVSKRTRFALQVLAWVCSALNGQSRTIAFQVQKPTGENSDNDSVTNLSPQGQHSAFVQ